MHGGQPHQFERKRSLRLCVVDFLDDGGKKNALVRIDTATGETLSSEIKYTDTDGDEVFVLLQELLQPVVESDEETDYVFVAGNTHDTGLFQLVAFGPKPDPKVLWSRTGKVDQSGASVDRRFSTTLFGDGSLGAFSFDGAADSIVERLKSAGGAGALLTDGAAPLLVLYTNQDIQNQLDEFAENLKQQDQKLGRELGEITISLTEQDQKLDRELEEVKQSLQEHESKPNKNSMKSQRVWINEGRN